MIIISDDRILITGACVVSFYRRSNILAPFSGRVRRPCI